MSAMTSQITGVSIIYSTVCSGADQRKHQSSASLAFVKGIHRWPVNSPHKGPVTRTMFPFDDVIMKYVELILITLIWQYSHLRQFPKSVNWCRDSSRHVTVSGFVPLLMWDNCSQVFEGLHDDVIKTFSALLVLCARNSPVNFLHKGQLWYFLWSAPEQPVE